MFFAAPHNSRRYLVCMFHPVIKSLPTIGSHKFLQGFTNSRRRNGILGRIFKFSFNIITNTHNNYARSKLRNAIIACIKQLNMNFIT